MAFLSFQYWAVTFGGLPGRESSLSEATPRSCQRLRMSVMASFDRPVTLQISLLLAPSADRSRHTARLPIRGVGGWSRTCWSRRRCHEVSFTSIVLFMPIPPGGLRCLHHIKYRQCGNIYSILLRISSSPSRPL